MGAESHYFIADETLEDKEETFSYYFGSNKIELVSNTGMFSPGHVDAATDLLLRELPPLTGDFLDLGCGYGVIGVSVGKAYAQVQVTMADINARALRYAKENAARNGVEAKTICSDGFAEIEGTFSAITLNPPIHAGKETIFALYAGSHAHLKNGGSLYIVIQKKHGAESSLKKLRELFSEVEILYKKKGYYVIAAKKA